MSTARGRATSFAHGRFPRPTTTLPSIIDADMTRSRTCARCHCTYVEWQNIGAWRCCDHMASWDDNRKLFPCCMQRSARGCVACDHAESLTVPYPKSATDYEVTRGAPAFKTCRGNLKELRDYYREAVQEAPDAVAQQRLEGSDELVTVYVFRRSLYGNPLLDQEVPST